MSASIHESGVDAAGVVDGMLSPNLALAFMALFEGLLSGSESFQHEGLTLARALVARQVHVLRDDSAPLGDIFLACEDDELFHALIRRITASVFLICRLCWV